MGEVLATRGEEVRRGAMTWYPVMTLMWIASWNRFDRFASVHRTSPSVGG